MGATDPAGWLPGERRWYLVALAEATSVRVERASARAARRVLGERAVVLGPPLRRVVHPVRNRLRSR